MHKTIKIGVVGATGYTGSELIRLLAFHPQAEVTHATSETFAGDSLDKVCPPLRQTPLLLEKLDVDKLKTHCELVFIALPHGHAIEIAETLLSAGIKVIDLGADFRLENAQTYSDFYGEVPASPDLLKRALYGLPEINERTSYRNCSLIANPGCYATAAILGAAPLLINNLVSLDYIVLDGKSGVSGAGKGLSLGTHYCEISENFKAYKVGGAHRHTPEIEQLFTQLSGKPSAVNFTPHLVPMVRGLFMTGYYKLKENIPVPEIREAYHRFYEHAPFVRILSEDQLPETAHVRGSNYVDMGINFNKETQTVVVTTVIDNLVKGAAGQAIQNMNLLYAFSETMGLV